MSDYFGPMLDQYGHRMDEPCDCESRAPGLFWIMVGIAVFVALVVR